MVILVVLVVAMVGVVVPYYGETYLVPNRTCG